MPRYRMYCTVTVFRKSVFIYLQTVYCIQGKYTRNHQIRCVILCTADQPRF